MSFPIVTSSGKYHDSILKNSAFIKTLDTGSEETGGDTSKIWGAAKLNVDKTQQLEKEATAAYREGRTQDLVALSKEQGGYISSGTSQTDGKTIVQNKGQGGITLSSIFDKDGQLIYTAGDAEKAEKQGVPTHRFFYEDSDFLSKAAEEYTQLGENEVFAHRNIDDVNFVRGALDFFTNGNYTAGDVNQVQEQMTNVVRELANQLKNGETLDYNKVESKLTIGGTEVTIGQLLDFQKVGGELKESFNNFSVGSSIYIQEYSKMGIAKAVGNLYGSDKGEIGHMFSSAIDRLYEKGITQIKDNFDRAIRLEAKYSKTWSPREYDALSTGLGIADVFSKLDTSSKESLYKDFTSKVSEVRSLVQRHCNQFGLSETHVGLAGDIADATKYMKSWLNQI